MNGEGSDVGDAGRRRESIYTRARGDVEASWWRQIKVCIESGPGHRRGRITSVAADALWRSCKASGRVLNKGGCVGDVRGWNGT